MPFPPALLPWIALAPFVAAVLAPALTAAIGARAGWVLGLVPAALFVAFAAMLPAVAAGEVALAGVDWAPTLGIRYAVRVDALALTFALLITGIGALIVVYAGGYLKGHEHQPRFMAFLLAFMGAMLGLVLADDLISLFVFYELTSIASFLLIGFDHRREAARRAAVQALIVTGGGGLCLLAGLVLMRVTTGATSVTELFAMPDALRDGAMYGWVFTLVCLGAFTKSAQVPFHSWLPNAMEAPTPVSAYLHSATMVKAGVFVLMRFSPVLGGTELWGTVLPLFGGATLLTGTVLAMRQTDLKQILAYTTVASLGLLVLLVGIGSEAALGGAALYLVAHALFKGGLFMVAGAVDHGTGTRDITRLGALAGKMPVTFAAAILGCLSMAGLPPLIGFVAKEVMYDGLWEADIVAANVVTVAGNALMFALAGMVLWPFVRQPEGMPDAPHEGSPSLLVGPLLCGLAALGTALLVGQTGELLIAPLAAAIAGHPVELHLHLLPTEVSPPVMLTLVTIGLGAVLFALRGPVARMVAATFDTIGWGPDIGFDQAMRGLVRACHALAELIQPGLMQRYMTLTFTIIAAALFVPLLADGLPPLELPTELAEAYVFVIIAIAIAGLAIVIVSKRRIVAIVSLGVQGVMVALIFMLFGAPDLSFTQFMVETLSVVILALVITRLDVEAKDHRGRWDAIKDGVIATVCGVGLALLLYGVTRVPFDAKLTDFFMAYAYAVAHGHNVVNVIIVDFRGLDTLGEIAVVAAVGLAILTLVRMGPRKPVSERV